MILLYACKKDQDEEVPIISWERPVENDEFFIRDTIIVNATIRDNEKIESVELGLFAAATGQLVQSFLSVRPDQVEYKLSIALNINDSLLNSGDYYFRIEAKDENNTQAAFRFIKINGIPRKKLGLIVACGDENESRFYTGNSELDFSMFHSSPEPYIASSFNSLDQHYWIIQGKNNAIKAFQMKDKRIDFEEFVTSNFTNLFTDIDIENQMALISDRNGEINGYDRFFSKSFNYRAEQSGRLIQTIKANEEYVLATEEDIIGTNKSIQVIFRNSGIAKSEVFISWSVRAIYFSGEDNAILFQNDENGGVLSDLDISADARRTMKTLNDSILFVEQITETNYLLATGTNILRYDLAKNSLFDYLRIANAILEYDELDNQLYIGSGSTLSVHDYSSGKQVDQRTFPITIKGLAVRYNR